MADLCKVRKFLLSKKHALLMASEEIFYFTASMFSPRVFAEKSLPVKQ